MLIIIALSIAGYYSIQNTRFQTILVNQFVSSFSKKIDHKITIDEIRVSLFNKVILKNVYVEDQKQDTLFYFPRIAANIKNIDRKKRNLHLSNVKVKQAYLKFTEDSLNQLNLDRFAKALKANRDTTKKKWKIKIHNVKLHDAHFVHKKYNAPEKTGINFAFLNFQNLTIQAKDLHIIEDSISMHIKKLHFIDHCGFQLNNLTSQLYLSKNGIQLSDGIITTDNNSAISFNAISLLFSEYSHLSKKHFYHKVKLHLILHPSTINDHDLFYLAPTISPQNKAFICSGNVTGTVSDLKIRNLKLSMGEKTTFNGNIDLNGLPDFNNTFIFSDIDHFATDVQDLQNLFLPQKLQQIKLPPALYKSGQLQYKGKFTGFIDDFVSYGIIFTDLGIISTDLLIQPDTAKYVGFKGKIKAHNFDIGTFTGNEDILGKVSLIVNISGSSSKEQKIYADLDGKIIMFEINEYPYRNIELIGKLTDKFFDGAISIHDPNIVFDFNGAFDFTAKLPKFDFIAELHQANLYNLHLTSSEDSLYTIKFFITADFKGKNINNLEGKISLVNSSFEKSGKKFQLSNLSFIADNKHGEKTLKLESDIINGTISGKYNFTTLISSLHNMTAHYIPSLNTKAYQEKDGNDTCQNNFEFYFDFKDTKAFCDFFIPGFCIAPGSYFYGSYNASKNKLNLTGISPELTLMKKPWRNIQVSIIANDSIFSIHSGGETFIVAENFELENFTILADAYNDNIALTARWNNWDTIINKGNVMANVSFHDIISTIRPSVHIDILPSDISFGKTTWHIYKSYIQYDSLSLFIDQLKLSSEDKTIECSGHLSGHETDKLLVDVRNFNLASLNLFTSPKGIILEGDLNGQAVISNIYTNPIINSSFLIDSLYLNHELLGQTSLYSEWDNFEKIINIDAVVKRGKMNTLTIDGLVHPKIKKIFFTMVLDKLRLNTFQPFFSKSISELNGITSGELKLQGNISKPLLEGDLLFQRTSFSINYLNTKYYFTNEIAIRKNNIFFKDFTLTDEYGQTASLNGKINTQYLRDLFVDLNINAHNFHFLNTTEHDNNQFYGKAFATGTINIQGPPKDLSIKASLKTDRNTEFSIPLSSGEEISENTYISWSNSIQDTVETYTSKEYKVDLSGVTMDFDLEVTPDAHAQIIFDSKVGDVIKSKGRGNMKFEINTLGKFRMYGDYVIEEGDYLFTLQNVINKKFKVESGSIIRWNGDPNDAEIDIKATYRLKASLSNLSKTTAATPDENVSRRIPVECQLFLTNKLMNPNIKFDIYLPSADEKTRDLIKSATSTEEDLSKQFLSLLVLNNFMYERDPNLGQNTTNGARSNVAGVTTSELLSNQLSHWLSQISNDFDIGVNYRPGDEITSDEVELALSTQVLNDRVSINGNVDVGGQQTNMESSTTNNIMGDFNVDVKITKSGKLRVKAFNRANNNFDYIDSPYTQGVGLFYREEFNNFKDLLKRYWNKAFKKEKK